MAENNTETLIPLVQETDGFSIIDHSNSVAEGIAPPSDTFTFESLQTCYAGVLIGANGRVVKERFDGEEKKAIKTFVKDFDGTFPAKDSIGVLDNMPDEFPNDLCLVSEELKKWYN